eukprot:scaffold2657_cov89-Amphora_coffeaeformis.AAC.36
MAAFTSSFAGTPVSKWKILTLGQAVSILYAIGGAIQSVLQQNCNWSAPTFAAGLLYLCCACLLIPLYWARTSNRRIQTRTIEIHPLDEEENMNEVFDNNPEVSTPPSRSSVFQYSAVASSSLAPILQTDIESYQYLFLGYIPIQGNPIAYAGMGLLELECLYLYYLALNYTSLAHVTLLYGISIPASMVVSRGFLARRYSWWQVTGALVCLTGTMIVFWHDYRTESSEVESTSTMENDPYPYKSRGNLLASVAGVISAASDVACEGAVKQFGGDIEYLGMCGFFAAIFAISQSYFVEREAIEQLVFGFNKDAYSVNSDNGATCSSLVLSGTVAAFVALQFASFLSQTRFLEISESALLACLTENFWSLAFSIIVEQITPTPAYYGALAVTIIGIVLYETSPSPTTVVTMAEIDILPGEEDDGISFTKVDMVKVDPTEHSRTEDDSMETNSCVGVQERSESETQRIFIANWSA